MDTSSNKAADLAIHREQGHTRFFDHCCTIELTMKVHLDTDLGGDTDDLCALALLLAWPEVEITGITTCTEQHGRRAGYVRYALQLAGRTDIPVAAGAEGGLSGLRSPTVLPDESDF